MKLKQRLKQELEKTKTTDWFKAALFLVIGYCGLKIFFLFYLDYVATMILTAAYLKSQGSMEFTNQLPMVIKWSCYYLVGLFFAIALYLLLGIVEKLSRGRKQ